MIRTRNEIIEEFQVTGISLQSWARSNGFNPNLVYQILKSDQIPLRGQSHRIAVALGLKTGKIDQKTSFLAINCTHLNSGGEKPSNNQP